MTHRVPDHKPELRKRSVKLLTDSHITVMIDMAFGEAQI